jgi:hypothetical protein
MKSIHKILAALILGAALTTALTFAPVNRAAADDKEKAEKPNASKAAAKPLKAAQDAISNKKYDEAIAKLKEVEALPNKSPFDDYALYQMLGFAQLKTGDDAGAEKSFEQILNSKYMEDKERPKYVTTVAQLNYRLKNYDKAIDFGTRAVKEGYADDNMKTLVSQAYYLKGNYNQAIKFTDGVVDSEIKQGNSPKETQLSLVFDSCVKLEDQPCETRSLERLVTYYPKPEYWQNLLYSMFQSKEATTNDRTLLDLYRLASEVDVLKRPQDYTEMAELALDQGSPGEAKSILEKGFAKNVFTDQHEHDRAQRLLENAKKLSATDQASLDKLDREASAAKTGDKDVGLGIAYISYQQYPKAIQALNQGLMKGVKNEAHVHLLLGIAQLKAGNKEDATKSFKAVKGDPTLERLANLWTLHAHQA